MATDTNWAGWIRTRKSASFLLIGMGGVVVSAATRMQTTLAMSSGEAEFYPGVSGAAEALFLPGAFGFFGQEPKVTLAMGLSAARGAASRVGDGRLETMELKTLWLQADVEDGPGTLQVAETWRLGRSRWWPMDCGMAGLVTKKDAVLAHVSE